MQRRREDQIQRVSTERPDGTVPRRKRRMRWRDQVLERLDSELELVKETKINLRIEWPLELELVIVSI